MLDTESFNNNRAQWITTRKQKNAYIALDPLEYFSSPQEVYYRMMWVIVERDDD